MKADMYDRLLRLQAARRGVLKGTAALGAAAALGGLGGWPSRALAQSSLRTEILQIPGVGMGSPTDADWQQVGALCLEPTKANVAEGEFAGVELTFMGLNNQNLHNFLFRGFLKPWEEYTGAKISWIDLAQADYNARLQQSIATGTVDFDILEMGAPFEGDVCGKGLASVMPDWVDAQIEMDDYVGYLQAPGRHLGRQDLPHLDRRRLPQLQLPHRLLRGPGARRGLGGRGQPGRLGRAEDLAAGPGGHQVPQRQAGRRLRRLRLPRSAQGLGRLRLLLPRQPRHRLCQASGRHGLAVRRRHDEAARQQPGLGARDPGRARRARRPAARPAQRRPRHHRLPAVPRRHRLDAVLVGRHRLERQDQRQLGHRRRLRLRHPAGLGRRLQRRDRPVGHAAGRPELRPQHGLYRLGHLRDGARRQPTRSSRRRPGALPRTSAARTSRCGARPILPASSPTATATSTSPNGSRPATTRPSSRATSTRSRTPTITPTPRSSRASRGSSSTTASPRTSSPRSTPASSTPRPAPTTSPRPGRRITDQIGRDQQIALYKASLGL